MSSAALTGEVLAKFTPDFSETVPTATSPLLSPFIVEDQNCNSDYLVCDTSFFANQGVLTYIITTVA